MEKIGKYEVLEKIGVGGFGVVYKGRDPFIKRFVAIKTCSTGDENIRSRFFREAEIAGRLQHRNVTTVYDFGFHGEVPYLVQEFLSGEDLDHLIKRRSHIPHELKLDYLLQIATGLEYAHSQGVIHRDIKPANIRVLEGGRLKIMDFGIAKLANEQSQLTRTGTTLGTAAYLAPEQIHGGEIDARVDAFSFGVVAYELLTFRRPFQAETISGLFYQILSIDPDPVERIWPECPGRLAEIVLRCLQKDPSDRYPDFTTIRGELEPLLVEVRAEAAELGERGTEAIPVVADGETQEATALLGAAELEELAAVEQRVSELLARGDATAAEIELELARRRFDGDEVQEILQPLEQRLAEVRRAREEERRQQEKVAALLDRGRELERAGNHQEALLALRTARDAAPDHPEVADLLARVEAAVEAARLELRRTQATALVEEGRELEARGELEAAAARLRQATELDGTSQEAAAALAEVEGEIEGRRRAAEREAAIATALAQARSLVERGKEQQAIRLLALSSRELGTPSELEALAAEVEDVLEQRRRALQQRKQERRRRLAAAARSRPARVAATVLVVGMVVLAAAAMWPERAEGPEEPGEAVSEPAAPGSDVQRPPELAEIQGDPSEPDREAPAPGPDPPAEAAPGDRLAELVDRAAEEARRERRAEQERQQRLAAQRPPAPPPTAPAREPEPARPAPSASTPAPTPAPPAPSAQALEPAPRREPEPAPAPAVDETQGIQQALASYRRAAESLDAAAVSAVWPSVNRRLLEQNYAALDTLSMSLDGCQIEVSGAAATATCRMAQRVKPKVGREQATTQRMRFQLAKHGDRWVLESLGPG